MIRYGVFIGVAKTGGLRRLEDARQGAERMYKWALGQGMEGGVTAHLITDETAPVTVDRIFTIIERIADGAGADQLIVYFAGHGVVNNMAEHWLLTDAPTNPGAAVDVVYSATFARYCGIQHVVFFSDACRVPSEGIGADGVRGGSIFPNNLGAGSVGKAVDKFYACQVGGTAAEVRDQAVAADNYSALYTEVLRDGLRGHFDEALEDGGSGDPFRYVQPWSLESYLEVELPRRVKARGLAGMVNQTPDSAVSKKGTWLARVAGGRRSNERWPAQTATSLQEQAMRWARSSDPRAFVPVEEIPAGLTRHEADQFSNTVNHLASVFGPARFESGCGIKVRGAGIMRFFSSRVEASLVGSDVNLLQMNLVDRGAASVVLELTNHQVIVIPVIRDVIAGVTVVGGELVDVSFEPSSNTVRYRESDERRRDVSRRVRAVAASSSRTGRLRARGEVADAMRELLRSPSGIDPTLALYAAYAYEDLGEIGSIETTSDRMYGDLRATFLDLDLLAGRLNNMFVGADSGVVPFVPLLTRGWSLLRAYGVRLPRFVEELAFTVHDSVWSAYPTDSYETLVDVLRRRMVR